MGTPLIRFGVPRGTKAAAVRRAFALALVAAALAAPGALLLARSAAARDPSRPTPSGFPVPRYVSLKFDEVNARAGPGDDYRLLWTYRVRGLPLQVIAETSDWRRVCDPEGAVAWVHQRTVDTRRMVMRTEAQPVAMRRHPKPDAAPAAMLTGRALARLDDCAAGWCRISVDRIRGWVRAEEVWGTRDSVQCRTSSPQPAP